MTNYSKRECYLIYEEITRINGKIILLSIKDLENPKTIELLKKAKSYLRIYKTSFPLELKRTFGFNPKNLKNRIKNAEECIKRLNYKSK